MTYRITFQEACPASPDVLNCIPIHDMPCSCKFFEYVSALVSFVFCDLFFDKFV